MQSSKIEELKRTRQQHIKKKRSQIPVAMAVTVIALVILAVFLIFNTSYGVLWSMGILIGITLQRSRFCFGASFRDPIMVGSTTLLKAVLIAFMISTVGFFIIQYSALGSLSFYDVSDVPGQLKPVGIHTVIGAILFGSGMVIAGGCASGTLMRIGEGFILQIVVLAGFIAGATTASSHFSFWDKLFVSNSEIIYIPQYIGFIPAFIIQMIVLALLYMLAHWYDNKNSIMARK